MADEDIGRSGWTQTESRIALVSVVISALGVVFAAASSFASWQQLEMLGRERMTPYKTVMFSSRLESYQRIVSSSAQFVEKSRSVAIQVESRQKGWLPPWSDREIDQLMQENASSFIIVKAAYQAGLPIWPNDAKKALEGALETARITSFCNAGWLANNGSNLHLKDTRQEGCRDTLEEQNELLTKKMDAANDAMSSYIQKFQPTEFTNPSSFKPQP